LGGGGLGAGGSALGGGNGSARRSRREKIDDSTDLSLDLLAANARQGPSSSRAGKSPEQEEGSALSGLEALSSDLPADSAFTVPFDILGSSSPQFFEAPAPKRAVAQDAAKKSSGNSTMLVGILALCVLGLGAATVFIVRKGNGPSMGQAPAVVTTVFVNAPSPQGTDAVADATATADEAAPASAAPSAPKPRAVGYGTVPAPPQGNGLPPAAALAPTAPAPAAPSRGPCGCLAGDLMCNMRCEQKHKKK